MVFSADTGSDQVEGQYLLHPLNNCFDSLEALRGRCSRKDMKLLFLCHVGGMESPKGIYSFKLTYHWYSSSLLAAIKFQRPDLHPAQKVDLELQIPLNPPPEFFESKQPELMWIVTNRILGGVIPEVGQLMLASFLESQIAVSKENPW